MPKSMYLKSVAVILILWAISAALGITDPNSQTGFTATLANGVTIELVGVCEHQSKDKQWWRPDGDPLNQHYITSTFAPDSFKLLSANNRIVREFVYKVGGPQGLDTSAHIDNTESAPGMVLQGGSYLPDLNTFFAALPKDAQTVTIKIAVAADPWTTVASNDPKAQKTTFGPNCEGSIYILSKGFATDKGNAAVTVSHNAADKDVRIIAIGADGKEYMPSYAQGAQLSSVSQLSAGFDGFPNSNIKRLPLKKVKQFQFQTRPYEWVEFKNVSLKLGQKTQIETKIIGSNLSDPNSVVVGRCQ